MQTSPSVYVLESKHYGSNQQLLALANVVADGRVIRPLRCELRSRRPWAQALCQWITALQQRVRFPSWLSHVLNIFLLKSAPSGMTDNDIIIGKTPPFEWVAARLSVVSGAKIYYLGKTKRIPRMYVSKFVSTPSTLDSNADIHLDILPTPWRYSDLLEVRKRFSKPSGVVTCTLLVGGNARSYEYDDSFWSQLIFFVKSSVSQGVCWKISSSPRTGHEVETRFTSLASEHEQGAIDFFPWSDPLRRQKTIDLLAIADAVFVTEESASMVSEAVNAKLPVVALMPADSCYNAQVTPLLEHLEHLGFLVRIKPADLSTDIINDWEGHGRRFLPTCWSEVVRRSVAK